MSEIQSVYRSSSESRTMEGRAILRKRPSGHFGDGPHQIKRTNSVGTQMACQLSSVHLGVAVGSSLADGRVCEVSPPHEQTTDLSFFPNEPEGKKSADLLSQKNDDFYLPAEESSNSLLDLVGEGDGEEGAKLQAELLAISRQQSEANPELLAPQPAPAGEASQEGSVSVSGAADETDGHFGHHLLTGVRHATSKLKREVEYLGFEISDRFSDVFQTFSGLINHHKTRPVQEDERAFSVHLPSQYANGDLCRFGAHLICSERGYRMVNVCCETLAHQAGLREHDLLTHINDSDVRKLNPAEVLKMFLEVKKSFTLTIQREVERDGHSFSVELRVQVTITVDLVTKEHEIEAIVRFSRTSQVKYITTSSLYYITQDPVHAHQVFLNAEPQSVTMGTYTDYRAEFVLDFYATFPMGDGQLCVVRNKTLNMSYDPTKSIMESIKSKETPCDSCLLYKRPRLDDTVVFESKEQKGSFLINENGKLSLCRCYSVDQVPPSGSFRLHEVPPIN